MEPLVPPANTPDEHPEGPEAPDEEGMNGLTRRDFLRGTGAIVFAASITVLATDCGSETHETLPPPPGVNDLYTEVPATPRNALPLALQFFSAHEAATVEAFTARIIPGTPDDPGAREAGVVHYIDNALAYHNGDDRATYRNGPFAHVYDGDTPPSGLDLTKVVPVKKSELSRYSYQSSQTPQVEYRAGIAAVDRYANTRFGRDFAALPEGQQDGVMRDMQENRATGFDTPTAQDFFVTLRMHTIEGMFCDPLYGGNQGMVGWRLVGFPGAQGGWTPTEMQTEGTTRPPLSIAMLSYGGAGHPAHGALLPVSGSRQR